MKQTNNVWKIGEKYMIRTVTMIDIGKLVKVTDQELVLENVSWIADTGRFMQFLKEGTVDEVEPFPKGEVIIGRGSIIDACKWSHSLDLKQK